MPISIYWDRNRGLWIRDNQMFISDKFCSSHDKRQRKEKPTLVYICILHTRHKRLTQLEKWFLLFCSREWRMMFAEICHTYVCNDDMNSCDLYIIFVMCTLCFCPIVIIIRCDNASYACGCSYLLMIGENALHNFLK